MSQRNEETNILNPEITQQPAVLSFDYETFKADLEKRLAEYRTVVTADTVKQAKETATELNKLKTDLDTRRKEAIRYVSAPIKTADDQMKECVRLVAEGRQDILDQVAKFDQVRLDLCEEKLIEFRDSEREFFKVSPEFYQQANDITHLVKQTNLTAKDNLTAAASRGVRELVTQERETQQSVERRLLELENASYRAGLAAPLQKAHVEHFIRADEDTYQAKLNELLETEVERDRQSREAMARDAERQAQAKPEPKPEPEPAATETRPVEQDSQPTHGGYQPQTEAKPQGAPAGKSEQFHMTVTMTATLPAGLSEAEIERQFRAFIEKGGNTKVEFMTVSRDSDEARDVA